MDVQGCETVCRWVSIGWYYPLLWAKPGWRGIHRSVQKNIYPGYGQTGGQVDGQMGDGETDLGVEIQTDQQSQWNQ